MEILNHIALPLAFQSDIQDFYKNILGFTEKYRFEIDPETAETIFRIRKPIRVEVFERCDFRIELYHVEDMQIQGISHICLNEMDIDGVCQRAGAAGYHVVRIDRLAAKLAFITDKTGNRFEIKQMIQP